MGEQQRDRGPRQVKFRHLNKDFLAEIYHKDQAKVGTCAKCGRIPEFVHILECRHFLCPECAASTDIYTCATHHRTTKIPVPLPGPLIAHEDLKKAVVICPGCHQPIMFQTIKAHIGKMHADLCKQGNQRAWAHTQAKDDTYTKNRWPPAKSVFSSCGAEDQTEVVDSRKTYDLRGAPSNLGTSYRSDYSNQQHASEKPPRQNRIQEGATIPGVSNGPGMSVVTPIDIMGRSRAPLPTGYGSDAGAAGWKRSPQTHKEDDLQRDSAVQQAPRPDESTALSEPAEEEYMAAMSPGGPYERRSHNWRCPSSPPTQVHGKVASSSVLKEEPIIGLTSPTETATAGTGQGMTDVSNTMNCYYCSMAFHVATIEEHQEMCGKLFIKCWTFFRPQIFNYCEAQVSNGPGSTKIKSNCSEDPIRDGRLPPPEYRMLLMHVIAEYYEEHLNKECQGIRDALDSFEEHIRTCQPFVKKCTEFWMQDVQLKDERKQPLQSTAAQQSPQNFQGEPEFSQEPPTVKADQEEQLQTAGTGETSQCPFCLAVGNAEENIEKHAEKCMVWFEESRRLFQKEIETDYAEYLSDPIRGNMPRERTSKGKEENGLLSPSVCQKWFTKVMTAFYQEHPSNPWQEILEDFAGFTECIYRDHKFLSKWKECLREVVLEYHDEDLKNRNKDVSGSLQEKKGGKSYHSLSEDRNGSRNEEDPTSEKCPYCFDKWDPDEFAEHVKSCQKQYINCSQCGIKVYQDDYKQHLKQKCRTNQQLGNHIEKAQEGNGREAGRTE
ncbi:uncharacterized protein LOC144142794 [Haemaphysalis longicornis]